MRNFCSPIPTRALNAFLLSAFLFQAIPALKADIYTYTLSLPNIQITPGPSPVLVEDDTASSAYQFSWVGPLMVNSAPNTACPIGPCGPVVPGTSVNASEPFYTFLFTANSTSTESQVEVLFGNANAGNPNSDSDDPNAFIFTMIEPDSFWATTGSSPVAFTTGTPNTDDGASFALGSDPLCLGCTVQISDISAAPEPELFIPVAMGMAGMTIMLRRRRRQAAAPQN